MSNTPKPPAGTSKTKRWNEDFHIFQLALRIDSKLREAQTSAAELMHILMERRQEEAKPVSGSGFPPFKDPPAETPAERTGPNTHVTVVGPAMTAQLFEETVVGLFETARSEKDRAKTRESVASGVKNNRITQEQADAILRRLDEIAAARGW